MSESGHELDIRKLIFFIQLVNLEETRETEKWKQNIVFTSIYNDINLEKHGNDKLSL